MVPSKVVLLLLPLLAFSSAAPVNDNAVVARDAAPEAANAVFDSVKRVAELDARGDNSPLGAAAGGLNDLFEVKGDVLIGPGGWLDKQGNFHEGEYTGVAKREANVSPNVEERGLLLGALLLGKARFCLSGWRYWNGCIIRPRGGGGDCYGFHKYGYPWGYNPYGHSSWWHRDMDDSAVTARGSDNSPLGAAAGGLNDLFEVQGDVLIGPGGWMDKSGNFHEGEYTGASKRDADGLAEPEEERTFGLLLGAIIGGKGGSFFHGWRRWSGCLIRPGGGYWNYAGWHEEGYPPHYNPHGSCKWC